MKYEIALFTLLASSMTFAADPAPDLTGTVNRSQLEQPAYPWMEKGLGKSRAKFKKRPITLRQIARALPGTEIEVYFGTWCSDSHDHLPPFFALLDEVKTLTEVEATSVKLIALDRKKSHPEYRNERKIEKLPTFVFLRNGAEIGRIVETPKKSIVEDTLSILNGKK